MDGKEIAPEPDGLIRAGFGMRDMKTTHGILVRNPEGFSRIVNLRFDAKDRNDAGGSLYSAQGVPDLKVFLPKPGVPLKSAVLTLSGETAAKNIVTVNGKAVNVRPDGRFVDTVELPPGKSRLVVEVTDPEGHKGAIERDLEVQPNHLFLLALADGKFGHLERNGHLAGTGSNDADEYYTEGRLAYYLKGMVAGKFLVTSAYDSDRNELDSLFDDLDGDASGRFFRNLDPDKLYPVYGDASTITYDSESQGKFYLAVENDELQFLIGNYPHNLGDTELATYRRTLYGGHVRYRSASTTQDGSPNTQVVLFGADVGQVHVRNELRATGGSLYYLSHKKVIEGSEQISILVRDKRTGLILSRQEQRQNQDYTIKYTEGRLVFRRPISSVALDGSLVDQEILSGNPVHIQVDFETVTDSFEETSLGARARQQIGDHVAMGGTYLEDKQSGGSYELQGVDTEVRFGAARVTGEYAESKGLDAVIFQSDDGGLSFREAAAPGAEDGTAWKLAAELDVGELIDRPDLLFVDAYHKELESGFVSSGNFLERGTEKTGVNARLNLSIRNSLLVRHNREKLTGADSSPGTPQKTVTTSAQWSLRRNRWGLQMEYLDRDREDSGGASVDHSRYGAAQLFGELTSDILARLERQETFSGPENDQTTAGVEYRAHERLSVDLKGTDGTRGRSAQLGAILKIGEGRLYFTERLADDRAGASTSTVLGAESRLGGSSRVYTEYQWDQAAQGQDRTISLLGIQKNWETATAWRFSLGGEISEINADPSETVRSALAGNVTYSSEVGMTAESRNEIRYETGDQSRTQYFTTNRLDVALSPDFTLLGKYRFSRTKDRDRRTIEARLNEGSIGLAYRPIHHDRFNGMARYTRLTDMRPPSRAGVASPERKMDVVSVEGAVALSPRLQWYSKGAARILEERVSDMPDVTTHTYLAIQRLDFWVDPIDLGVEYRILRQREADDSRQGWVTELSRKLKKYLRLGVGYNFTDFSDNEFSSNDYSVRGWYVRAQGKY
jgi:hypothetical protein